MSREVIASWGISNTASLNVYSIEHGIDDVLIVGINDDEPEEVKVLYTTSIDEEDESLPYIEFHGNHYFLNECIRL